MYRFLLLIFFLSFSVLSSRTQNCTATLCGSVIEAESGEFVPYAQVYIQQTGDGTVTDESGRFHFHNLCEGTYTIVCRHIGCEHLAKEVKIRGNVEVNFELRHVPLPLSEVMVKEKAITPVGAQARRSLEGAALDAAKGRNLGILLSKIPGVTILNTGSNIVKPVIRGLHSNRILIMNHGVRQEGQQWGADHAPEIDPFTAGSVSVVYGANSVRYGSDAIGGIVLIEPKPLPEKHGTRGEVFLAGYSNGGLGVFSARMDHSGLGKLPLSARVQGTLRRGGNLHTPDYFLENTGLREANYATTLSFRRKHWDSEVFFSHFFTDIGILSASHIGNLTDLQNAIERGRPLRNGVFSYELGRPLQRVAHYLLKAKTVVNTGESAKWTFQYARQFNHRREFDAHRRFGTPPADFSAPDMRFEITSHTFDMVHEHRLWRYLSGAIGAQVLFQRNTTDRGGLIPDFDNLTSGIFWMERWRRYPLPLEVEVGLRFDFRRLSVSRRGSEWIGRQLNFSNWSGIFGLVWRFSDMFRMQVHAGSAWRSPNVNELFSEGVHHGTASYEKGNANLLPERAFSKSITFVYEHPDKWSANVSFFQNDVHNFIFLQPMLQPVITIRGVFPGFTYEQAQARLSGFDWYLNCQISSSLAFFSSGAVLRARNRSQGEWLIGMPADRLQSGFSFYPLGKKENNMPAGKTFLRMTLQHVFRQTRAPMDQDYTPPPPPYTLIHAEAGTLFVPGRLRAAARSAIDQNQSPERQIEVGILIENLLNTNYRDYLNRLRYFSTETGRNVSLRIKFIF